MSEIKTNENYKSDLLLLLGGIYCTSPHKTRTPAATFFMAAHEYRGRKDIAHIAHFIHMLYIFVDYF